ncbi:hypothetical protein C8Q78DRAFT_529228 [Trametes maxima]|nr:hypothetical protein C8Q78DRAFT_529228 [Trametes maxima]
MLWLFSWVVTAKLRCGFTCCIILSLLVVSLLVLLPPHTSHLAYLSYLPVKECGSFCDYKKGATTTNERPARVYLPVMYTSKIIGQARVLLRAARLRVLLLQIRIDPAVVSPLTAAEDELSVFDAAETPEGDTARHKDEEEEQVREKAPSRFFLHNAL